MKKLTKKYVIENTSISRVYTTSSSTLEGCRFKISYELQNRGDDRLYVNLLKWGWVVDKGRLCITWEGIQNLRMV
jgi:hypothetical protein